jgi:hypothetical protein
MINSSSGDFPKLLNNSSLKAEVTCVLENDEKGLHPLLFTAGALSTPRPAAQVEVPIRKPIVA